MMAKDEALDDKIKEFQVLQSQLQMVAVQRQQSHLQKEEMEDTLKKLENVEGKVYRFTGTLFVESTREEARKDIEEKLEVLKVRESTLSKQEERLTKRAGEVRAQLEGPPAPGAG